MAEHMPIMIGSGMIEKFIQFCEQNTFEKFLIVADENTAPVLGDVVHAAVIEQGWDAIYLVLDPDGLHADDTTLARVFNVYDAVPRLFVAVGSGTITDTTRFTSHRSQNQFVSFPTAASVDAYTSRVAPVTIGGLKGSVACHPPIAIFTDMDVICDSPRFLTASGFGDLIAKLTSSADWKITQLVWGADFDETIYASAIQAAKKAADAVEGIRETDPESMQVMMEGQFASGFCMADFGNSAPASGAEHHIAHVWEMMFHWDKREGLFHGNAVGVAAIQSAHWYQRLRAVSRDEAEALLKNTVVSSRRQQMADIRENLPIIAEELNASDPIYMQLSDPKKYMQVCGRILDHWDDIQTAAAHVPTPDVISGWIKSLGGPVTAQELELTQVQAKTAMDYGHYLRERFSINILRTLFGW
jgi:glycerol-1-phosphate dehydrogenase [NAD(P)+]